MGYDVGRHQAHANSAGVAARKGERLTPREKGHRHQEAVHGGGVHGSGVWTTEHGLNDWHLNNSIKYCGPFHPEYVETPVAVSKAHKGMHDATLDFRTAVRGIVPGYAGHVPRARDMYGEAASGGITPERGWKRDERTGQMLEATYLGPMGDRAYADGPDVSEQPCTLPAITSTAEHTAAAADAINPLTLVSVVFLFLRAPRRGLTPTRASTTALATR